MVGLGVKTGARVRGGEGMGQAVLRRMVCGLFAGVCASFGPQAAGRFLEVDADEIDAEAVYGSETFNDKLSYRLPSAWVRLWDAHDTGVRVSAGSLDIRRFDYLEDVKLVAAPDGPLSIGFEQTRREDSLEARTERAFRIEGRLSGPLRLFMLGDGGVNKEYGDVGWGVAWRRDRDHDVRAYVWSVDHFYDSKKVEPDDRRTRKPDTAGAKVRWVLGEVRLAAELEADHPLRWHRPSLGYDYEYERRVASYRVEVPQGDALSLFAEGRHEVKLESRMWQGGGSEQGRAMERRADSLELGMERSEALEDWTAGVAFFKRRATYRVVAPAGLPEGELIEAAGDRKSVV